MLLERYDLKVVRIGYPATARSLRQIYYSLFLLNKRRNRFKEFAYRHIPEDASISLNTYDIMLAVAEKLKRSELDDCGATVRLGSSPLAPAGQRPCSTCRLLWLREDEVFWNRGQFDT